jgi:hypothetical protein
MKNVAWRTSAIQSLVICFSFHLIWYTKQVPFFFNFWCAVVVFPGTAATNAGVRKFSKKIEEKLEYFICQKCEMKQVLHGASTNIMHINCPGSNQGPYTGKLATSCMDYVMSWTTDVVNKACSHSVIQLKGNSGLCK